MKRKILCVWMLLAMCLTPIESYANKAVVDGIEVYVPSYDDDFVFHDEIPLSLDVQEYIWNKCKNATDDYKRYYAFFLGSLQLESSFKPGAKHTNKDGSVDRGIAQINSCNVKKMKKLGLIDSADDLYDVYKCLDCGFYMMDYYIGKFGVNESAYYAYNTGIERNGTNANSKKVMKYMANWERVLNYD